MRADANPGYSVFYGKGTKVYPQNTSAPAASVNVPFHVQVSITDLNIRKGLGTDYGKIGKFTGKGVFTITEVKSGKVSDMPILDGNWTFLRIQSRASAAGTV